MNTETLVVILSHSGANEAVARHWPWYCRAGCDIIGVGRTNTKCLWPKDERLIDVWDIGEEGYAQGENHLRRLIGVLRKFLQYRIDYTDICVIEYDGIFLRPLPPHKCGLITTPAGGRSSGFLGSKFYHTPWWIDRSTAADVIVYGERMLKAGLIEQGFVDRWLGLMADLYGMQPVEALSYTANTLDRPELIQQARAAISAGAVYVHGVKTAEQLEAVTKGF